MTGARKQEAKVIPLVGSPEWLDSRRLTAYVSNREHFYRTTYSEVNIAVCDSGWESAVAAILDNHPEISSWIRNERNERLGWTIPYKFDSIPRQYEPDFIALSPTKGGKEIKLVIEVKGQERPTDPEKARWTEEYWKSSVNQHPAFSKDGPWTYVYLDHEPSPAYTGKIISEAIALARN